MFLPFYRGDGVWVQRLLAVDYLRKVEFLHQLHSEYAPQETGLNLPISAETYISIASPAYLKEKFGPQYLSTQNSLAAGFQQLNTFCRRHSVSSLRDMGPEFDFSVSVYIDQYCLKEKGLREILHPLNLDSLPKTAVTSIDLGFMSYKENRCKEALHYFKQALTIEPGLYPLLFPMGLIHLNCPEFVDEGNAFYYFKTCGHFAENRNDLGLAARAFLHASFAAYLLTKDHEAMQLALKAITLDSTISESYYLYAKIATMHEPDSALIKIRTAVAMDEQYVLKAGADKDFYPILGRLFTELYLEAESKAAALFTKFEEERERIKQIERSLHDYEVRISQVGIHRKFFDRINDQFDKLEEIYRRGTFFDYNLFLSTFDKFGDDYLNPGVKEQLKRKYKGLQERTRTFSEMQQQITLLSARRRNVKLFSFILLNFSFFSLIWQAIDPVLLSPDWLVLVPFFTIATVFVAFGDVALKKTQQFLYGITLHKWGVDEVDRIGSNLMAFMNRFYQKIYFSLNTVFLVAAFLFTIFADPGKRPGMVYFFIFFVYVCLWLYDTFKTNITVLTAQREKLDGEINEILQYPLG